MSNIEIRMSKEAARSVALAVTNTANANARKAARRLLEAFADQTEIGRCMEALHEAHTLAGAALHIEACVRNQEYGEVEPDSPVFKGEVRQGDEM